MTARLESPASERRTKAKSQLSPSLTSSTPIRPGATWTATWRALLVALASPAIESARTVHSARPGRSGMTWNSAVASAPSPGAITVARSRSAAPSMSRSVTGVPRGSRVVTRARTVVARPTWASAADSTSVTARSGPPATPTRSACTGTPRARAAAAGSSPALTAPSLTTTTPPARCPSAERASSVSASPIAVPSRASGAAPRRAANGTTSTAARPRQARGRPATASSAACERGPAPGAAGSSMLAERSSSTTMWRPAPLERSSTGCASSHASSTSAAMRSAGSPRRASAGSGGIENR